MLAEEGTEKDIESPSKHEQRKYDGTRTFLIRDGDRVMMWGRSWVNDYADRFPEIVAEVKKISARHFVLDTELTFFKPGTDKDVFLTALANPETKKGYVAKLMAFDVLFVGNTNVEKLPFTERQKILSKLVLGKFKHIDVVETVTKGKKAFFQSLKRKQGEGVMLKESKSLYKEGTATQESRSRDWLKLKHWKSDEACVVGYTHGKGYRESTLGALILAKRDQNGKWRHVGNVSGFSEQQLKQLLQKMEKLKVAKPIVEGLPSDKVKAWVKPKIVVEVKYYEKTPEGIFRFPDFVRERDDKAPEECKI